METMSASACLFIADTTVSLRMVRALGLGLVWFMLLVGCAPEAVDREPQPIPPSHILGREVFVNVLTEIQLVEAISDLRTYRNDNERERLSEAYNDVWARTGVSAEQFETSYAWWWDQPAAMKAVLRDVVDSLKRMESDLVRRETDEPVSPGDLKNRPPVDTPSPSMK